MTAQKWGALALYVALAIVAVSMPGSTAAQVITWIFIVLAVLHLVEFVAMYRLLAAAGGSMAMHFAHTFVFGIVHWLPLKRQQAR